jgi:hypothetical protein
VGKAKKRSFNLGINDRFSNLKREDAISEAVSLLEKLDSDAYNIITLFGLSAEELLEAGASYESVKSIQGILG